MKDIIRSMISVNYATSSDLALRYNVICTNIFLGSSISKYDLELTIVLEGYPIKAKLFGDAKSMFFWDTFLTIFFGKLLGMTH